MMRWNATNYPIGGAQEQVFKLLYDIVFGISLSYLVPRLVFGSIPILK